MPVGHRQLVRGPAAVLGVDVPRAPGRLAAGEQAVIGMEDDLVGRVLEHAQRVALRHIGVVQERPALSSACVAMTTASNRSRLPARRRDVDPLRIRVARPRTGSPDRTVPAGQALDDALDVLRRAAHDGPPGMAVAEADEPMVVEEAEQVVDGEVHDPGPVRSTRLLPSPGPGSGCGRRSRTPPSSRNSPSVCAGRGTTVQALARRWRRSGECRRSCASGTAARAHPAGRTCLALPGS